MRRVVVERDCNQLVVGYDEATGCKPVLLGAFFGSPHVYSLRVDTRTSGSVFGSLFDVRGNIRSSDRFAKFPGGSLAPIFLHPLCSGQSGTGR